MKTNEQKKKLIEQIRKTPIIQIACEKSGIGRATYYRWKKDDAQFREAAEEALYEGESLINDMAESQLISAIRNQNMTAIIFWLKNHHKKYRNKVEVSGTLNTHKILTPDEEEMIQKSLVHAGLIDTINLNHRENEKH
jgi:hypothetical protein